jgi:DNA modification methylase
MRQLPSESIDLIYIDPPFFSGRTYNVIFGDKNEVRSFSDIWEGGMPGYLVWLNARLYEMKRLLKPNGSIWVHLDWHASHYVKAEMDKTFGAENFRNEVIWQRFNYHADAKRFGAVHDTLLWYSRGERYIYNQQFKPIEDKYKDSHFTGIDPDGRLYQLDNPVGAGQGPARSFGEKLIEPPPGTHWRFSQEHINQLWTQGRIVLTSTGMPRTKRYLDEIEGTVVHTIWADIPPINSQARERIGYPTQKPQALLERILLACSGEGSVVADFFCGGGTTPAVAQRLNRRWIACDQSRIAVSITADRVAKVVQEKIGELFPVPDFTVEHWGVYETPQLETLGESAFREFVVRAFGGRPEAVSPAIHGTRSGVPLYVGEASRRSRIGKEDVARFAKAVYEERRANHGVMLAWNFSPEARKAAEILAARENKRIDFVRLNLVRIESDEFREHVVSKHADYAPLLSFVQPPEVRVAVRRVGALRYEFDVSESVSLNKDGGIANVQWDFHHTPGRFTSTQGYTFLRDKKTGRAVLVVEYAFPKEGQYTIACSVQDDQGGERTVAQTLDVR